ncbi:AbrB/MazE/SpoVT family DNA-binding domain-containing protein [Pseudomonas sp.]|uniref:AbrB/MazE/SpoVT family DNA-binding domain-containing protein n=1 Tax=Pseudomonas sp. TaxID=306 RepID=UPI003D6FC65B
MDEQRRWTSFCHDAEDGSGDLVIDLPTDMLAELGWKVGDRLSIDVEGGLVIIRLASKPAEIS